MAQATTTNQARVDRPGAPLSPAPSTGHPGRPGAMASVPHAGPWKDSVMSTQAKPKPTEDAVEQARRALQTSMDTRQ